MSIMIKLIFHLFFLNFFNFSITFANDDLMYIKHTCSTNKTFTPNSAYQSNLHTLLTSLSSHAAATQFHNTTAGGGDGGETIYGLFMCRGDVTNQTCQECMSKATQQIASKCLYSKEAILWYHECFVRYSNRSFFSTVDEWPRLEFVSYNVTTNITKEGSYGWLLAKTLTDAVAEAANGGPVGTKKFATRKATLKGSEDVYALVECTPDLSSEDCRRCLGDIMSNIPLCCLGRDGGMVLYPSCSLMFGLHLFYRDAAHALARTWTTPTPPLAYTLEEIAPLVPTREQKARSPLIITAMVPIVVFLMVFFFSKRIRRNNALRRYKAVLKENFGNESNTLESLQFDLATIEAATNKFSYENLIGKGGFGEVYKGILPDGREVAVKRLSKDSRQGGVEFKNEVLLIAKLQHRNLVALLGFCLQEEEKILVYEFVPNKSLDYFLFDPQKQRLLSWSERYKIIGGIARAILYLHEYSRLKIIHRDIKPSNILLDDKMNPKISDFGMARMVDIDQEQGRTNRIVGTYGYMSPEYAMLGKFSEKSDVFSFGVMVLEIISGKRNSTSYNKPNYVDGLSSSAWKHWRDGTPFEILDSSLLESCSQTEVIKSIQIGLLCVQENPDDRPLMAEVVSYLSNPSIELPFPSEPAFFIHNGMETNMAAIELELGCVTSNSTPLYSINEMSISESFPR